MANLFECDHCDYESKTKGMITLRHNSIHENLKLKFAKCGYQFSKKRQSYYTPDVSTRRNEISL